MNMQLLQYLFILLQFLFITSYSNRPNNDINQSNKIPRNDIKTLKFNRIITNSIKLITFIDLLQPTKSNAAKGAFEMDMEYYMKNLVYGNEKVSIELQQSTRKPIYKSPRSISITLANNILNITTNEISKLSKISPEMLIKLVDNSLSINLTYYKSFLPIRSNSFDDQYYYDVYLCTLYMITSKLIPDSQTRVILKQNIGNKILNYLITNKLIDLDYKQLSGLPSDFPTLCKNTIKILEYYKSNGFIANYIFDYEDVADIDFAKQSFDQGLPVSFQITLQDPIPLISFIEMTLADTLFHPEIIASTITSYIRNNNFNCRFDDYLMDNFYREENYDVRAQDIIIEMLINKQSK